MNSHTSAQFSVRSLLFVTFVVALASGVFQVSLVAGCLMVVPMAIALTRTLRCHRAANGKRHSLAITFLQSLALLAGFLAVSMATITVSTVAVALISIDGQLRAMAKLASACWQRLLQGRIAVILLFLGRILRTVVTSILTATRGMAVSVAMKLNRTNRSMAAYWRHPPTVS